MIRGYILLLLIITVSAFVISDAVGYFPKNRTQVKDAIIHLMFTTLFIEAEILGGNFGILVLFSILLYLLIISISMTNNVILNRGKYTYTSPINVYYTSVQLELVIVVIGIILNLLNI